MERFGQAVPVSARQRTALHVMSGSIEQLRRPCHDSLVRNSHQRVKPLVRTCPGGARQRSVALGTGDDLPACSRVLDAFAQFLYHIGEQSLPEAFVRVARRLREGTPSQMLRKFIMEVLLERYVYGRPLELKSHDDLRTAVLFLLDALVEQVSSAAFRMRDDFVTPVSVS